MQKYASEMRIVTFIAVLLRFIDLFYSILFILCHVHSIMMFKCTLMKEQINFLKIKIKTNIQSTKVEFLFKKSFLLMKKYLS